MKKVIGIIGYCLLITVVFMSCRSAIRADEGQMSNEEAVIIVEENDSEIEEKDSETEESVDTIKIVDLTEKKDELVAKFQGVAPTQWGERVDGVINRIDTTEKIIALTFDACGGGRGLAYDEALINFLIEEKIPATLFISGGWIDANRKTLEELAANPLFEIANHGHSHKPLSVEGRSAYNIQGTTSVEEAFDEVYKNQLKIYEVTGKFPLYFRSGTAYYDNVVVELLEEMGMKAINYNVLGDAGATFSKNQIVKAIVSAKEGSIILLHMNKPNSPIADGVKEGVLKLKNQGFTFVHLSRYHDLLKE